MLWNQFKKPEDIEKVIKTIKNSTNRTMKFMEICGTHTMSIAKSGIKSLLPSNIKLISGPGCPVCVTPADRIDKILELSENRNIIIATYGDMLKVPGTKIGDSLERRRALGANVQIVYSSVDAVETAKNNPSMEVVFLGIGFETTAPGTAIAIDFATEQEVSNFSVFSMHKLVEPVLRELIHMDDFHIDGFLCPGNVSIILGERGFEFLSEEYKIPSVICGFESGDILVGIYKLICQVNEGRASLENEYTRVVSYEGNKMAQNAIYKYFKASDDLWRGMGLIKNSGLSLRDEYNKFNAVKKFGLVLSEDEAATACRCGEVIKGKDEPDQCPMFGTVCTPENPVGPCMVSSEGACAALYKYGRI